MIYIKDRLMCNALYCKNGTLAFKQVDTNITPSEATIMCDFHKLILETAIKNKYFNHELLGYRFTLTKENHMAWRIDIFKDEVLMDFFSFKCKSKEPGIPKVTKKQYSELIEELC